MTHDPELPSILAELHRGWRRRWLAWAAVYVLGFAVLLAAGLAQGWPFYAWAIGWALVKGLWDEVRFQRAIRDERGRYPKKDAADRSEPGC